MRAIRKWVHFVVIIAIILVGEVCFAGDDEDFEYWNKTSVSYDINKDWWFVFEEKLTFGHNAGELSIHSSDFGFVYKGLAEWLEVGVNFKKEYARDSERHWKEENRPHFNLTVKGQLWGMDVSNRSRLEYRDREDEKDVWRFRNKLTATLPEFTELKIRPYVAEEPFINFDASGFNKNRVYAGFVFPLAKNVKGDIHYVWQTSRSEGSWREVNVIGTELKFYF